MPSVAQHYERARPAREGQQMPSIGIAPDGRLLSLDELGGFDHFHTAGALATARMADLVDPAPTDTVLDAGAGLGGPARYLADRFGCRVIGVDLTPVFVEVGRLLNDRTGLGSTWSTSASGDITRLDLEDGAVDHAWSQHVAMNIADRSTLYARASARAEAGRAAGVVRRHRWRRWRAAPARAVGHRTRAQPPRDSRGDALAVEDAGFRVDVDEDPAPELCRRCSGCSRIHRRRSSASRCSSTTSRRRARATCRTSPRAARLWRSWSAPRP